MFEAFMPKEESWEGLPARTKESILGGGRPCCPCY